MHMLKVVVALFAVAVLRVYGDEESLGPATVQIRLSKDQPLVPYVHPGGPLLDTQLRDFCKEQLKAEMGKNGINGDHANADPLFGLLENLWVSCRNMLREKLPAALRAAAAEADTPPVEPPSPSTPRQGEPDL